MELSNTNLSSDRYYLFSIISLTFIVYAWSAPSAVTLEDDGYFIMAAYFNGVAHPPGYPLYTLLAHIATWIPLGSVAYRVHLISSLFGALTCACVYLIARRLVSGKVFACATALTLAFSSVFWSQSIIAEVYTLNTFLVTFILLLSLKLNEQDRLVTRLRTIKLIFFLYGLGLCNHWPILLLSTPMIIIVLWPNISFIIRNLFRVLPYLILGLSPYIWMVLRSQMQPEASFYGSIDSLAEFWFVVSRQAYANIDSSVSAGWQDKLQYGIHSLKGIHDQFAIIGTLFLVLGFFTHWKIWPKPIVLGLLLGFIFNSIIIAGLLGFDYDLLHVTVFRVYPLIAYIVCSLWIGLGIHVACRYVLTLAKTEIRREVPVFGLSILVTGSILLTNVAGNYRQHDNWAEKYSKAVLRSLPENSVLFLYGDTAMGPIGYTNKIENFREDIELYSVAGQVFNNRLYKPFKTDINEVRESVDRFISTTSKPIFYTEELIHDYPQEYYGLYFRVLKDQSEQINRAMALPGILSFLDNINQNGLPYDPWERIHYRTLMSRGCLLTLLIRKRSSEGDTNSEYISGLSDRFCDNLLGLYYRIHFILDKDKPAWHQVAVLLRKAKAYIDQARTKEELSRLDYYTGEMLLNKSRPETARQHYLRSVRLWDHPKNPALTRLDLLDELSGNK